MVNKFAALAALATTALAAPQPRSDTKAPKGEAPSGCEPSYDGDFTISIIAAVDDQSSNEKRTESAGALTLKLKDGVLTDQNDRIGSIVASHQFQFDKPAQSDAIHTSGFSVCKDKAVLALGDSTTFYKCSSGSFANLYDQELGDGGHCQPISFRVSPAGGSGGSGGSGGGEDVTQIDDGQPQAPTAGAPSGEAPPGESVSQIDDGQPQVPSGEAPVPTAEVPAPPGESVSQIDDGQPQVPTGEAPVPTAEVPVPPPGETVSQIDDGQPQAPTGEAPVPTAEVPVPPPGETVSQIDDGQPQAPTGEAPGGEAPPGETVSQIDDGQPQAPTGVPPPGETGEVPPPAGNETVPGTGAGGEEGEGEGGGPEAGAVGLVTPGPLAALGIAAMGAVLAL